QGPGHRRAPRAAPRRRYVLAGVHPGAGSPDRGDLGRPAEPVRPSGSKRARRARRRGSADLADGPAWNDRGHRHGSRAGGIGRAVPTPPPSVVLLWGEDPFLLRTSALELADDRRVTEVDAAEWQGSELQDLATPSLFGEPRALIVTDLRALPKEAMNELGTYLALPDPDAQLILCCTVAERGKPPAAVLELVEPVGRVTPVQPQRQDFEP